MLKNILTMCRMTTFIMLLCLSVIGQCAFAQTSGTVTYVYTDPQGTPLAEANSSGAITATFDYTPYGTTALGAPPNGPGYTGHVNDPETNLVYMQARYYDSATGRFLSVDPIAPKSADTFGFNRYVYTQNNPIVHVDPNGKCIEDLCIGETIIVVEGVEAIVSAVEAEEAATAVEAASAATTETASSATAETTSATTQEASAESAATRSTARVNPDGETFTDSTGRVRQGSSNSAGQGKRISNATRAGEREASGNKCIYCGKETTNEPGQPNSSQGDHIQPRAGDTDGGAPGDNSPGNTGNSCAACNNSKSNQPVLRWIQKTFGGSDG